MIEIHCHGGVNVVKNILDLVIKNGARLAERGEFTKRAFLNKKLDLSQAEAVADLIHAKTRNFAVQSAKNLSGVLSEKVSEIKGEIFEVLSRIVAGIDFPEDVAEPEYSYLIESFEKSLKKLTKYLPAHAHQTFCGRELKLRLSAGRMSANLLFSTLF